MDAIKMEPEVDPLAVQPCDDAIKQEENPSSDEGNSLDLHVTKIKEEYVDDSYDHTSEIKSEEIVLSNNFPVVKCEAEEYSFDVDRVQQAQTLEISTEEDEVLIQSIVDNVEKTESSECDGIGSDEDMVTQIGSYRPHGSFVGDISHDSIKCNICNKVFVTPESMKRHSHIHTLEKSFKCDVCGKRISNYRNLKRHIAHLHTNRSKFNCDVCGRSVSDAEILKRHMRLHTDSNKFYCVICEKNVSNAENLKKHIRLHTGRSDFNSDYVERVLRMRKD
ncbi:zinc finger and BTB domain-containing protein 14-like [Periplaneta americana]|uniref:zinc finger and BTB domain-containing protein 14-like n=1 Tax=Periplaneta americana TaxID=6978 RepID=UPI0037E70185